MTKKSTRGSMFNEAGEQVWRFSTPYRVTFVKDKEGNVKKCGDNFTVYVPTAIPEYKELLEKGARGELGDLPQGQGKKPGECFHTKEMLAESAIAVADEDGFIETSVREHAIHIARVVPEAVLDKSCDQSILDEVKKVKKQETLSESELARQALERKAPVVNTKLKI